MYKRQAQDLECIKADAYRQSHPEKRDGKTGHCIEAVSYTHLDVYKRQYLHTGAELQI